MLQIHAFRNRPLAGFIKNPVGLQLLVAGVHSAVSVGVKGAPELPTSGIRENLNLVEQLLHGEFHIQQHTRFRQAVIRKGVAECHFWCHFSLVFGAIWCLKVPLFHRKRAASQAGFWPDLFTYSIDLIGFIWRRGRDSNPR